MFKLLNIKVDGFRMLKDNFEINFITKSRINSNEVSPNSEIFKLDDRLYLSKIISFTGSNASGKTTILKLISKILILFKNGRWENDYNDFSKDSISLDVDFYLNKEIYKYSVHIFPTDVEEGKAYNSFSKIVGEELYKAKYLKSVGKKYNKLKFENCSVPTGIEDTSQLQFLCKNEITFFEDIDDKDKTKFIMNFCDNKSINIKLLDSIIKLFDDSIEYIRFSTKGYVFFKRIGENEKNISIKECISLLSSGTIKGLILYYKLISAIKTGGYILIDEIEDSFHKNLVDNLIFLIEDNKINKNNAILMFSTHYVEILDTFNRRDGIYVMHRNKNKINCNNLYLDYNLRTEILKSNQFNNNTFGTLINYDYLMDVKRNIKHEIFNND